MNLAERFPDLDLSIPERYLADKPDDDNDDFDLVEMARQSARDDLAELDRKVNQ